MSIGNNQHCLDCKEFDELCLGNKGYESGEKMSCFKSNVEK